MKKKRNFIISGILIFLAGFFSHFAWMIYEKSSSVSIMILAGVLFMAGVIIFAINFKE